MATKKVSDYIPIFKALGIDYVQEAPAPTSADGVPTTQSAQVTLTGDPHSIVFADLSWPDMADADYVVQLGGETASVITVDQSTLATTGFDILNGLNSEVAHVTVIGSRVA